MKKFLALPIAIASTFAVALPALADSINTCPPDQFSGLCNLSFSNGLIGTLITFAFVIAIILALAWLIYGGIRWILSQGDKGKVDSARQHIIAALIGLIIVFLSYFLLNIVLTFFGIPNGISGLTIPSIVNGQVFTGPNAHINCVTACVSGSTSGFCTDTGTGSNLQSTCTISTTSNGKKAAGSPCSSAGSDSTCAGGSCQATSTGLKCN